MGKYFINVYLSFHCPQTADEESHENIVRPQRMMVVEVQEVNAVRINIYPTSH